MLLLMQFSEDLSESFALSDEKLGKVSYNHFLVQKALREQGALELLIRCAREIDPLVFWGRRTQY